MITHIDDHGVKEFKAWFILAVTLVAILLTVTGGGYLMYITEGSAGNANVTTWKDGIWVVTMIMTTIGFGDYYPVTDLGRVIGWVVFIFGALEIGSLISLFTVDRSIKNKELRTMLCEVMRKMEHLEDHLEIPTYVTPLSHGLDVTFEQSEYSSNRLRDGFITIGKDSTGLFILAVDAYDRETDQEVHRWLCADDKPQLYKMYKRFILKENEL